MPKAGPTRYTYRCPRQSYAINLEMCLARQLLGGRRCQHCRNRQSGEFVGPVAPCEAAGAGERVAA